MSTNYGAMDNEDNENQVPLVTIVNMKVDPAQTTAEDRERLRNPFDETYFQEDDFYRKVSERCAEVKKEDGTASWRECETRCRLEQLKIRFKKEGVDPLVALMTTCYDDYQEVLSKFPDERLNDAFEQQLSEFVAILLDEDNSGICKYKFKLAEEGEGERRNYYRKNNIPVKTSYDITAGEHETSVLHLAAHRNVCLIATKFLTLYPETICRTDFPSDPVARRSRMAVEIGLDANNDDICQLLMSRMLNERVRKLFTSNDEDDISNYRLSELVANGDMKKTVLAVLNSCVNPDLPFLKEYKEENGEDAAQEEVWSQLPTIPLRYNFFFEVLDGDYEGDYIGDDEGNYMDPSYFNITSPSALQMITCCVNDQSVDNDPIRHMVVRQLVRKKWEDYGRTTVMIKGAFYLFYLIALSLGLFMSGKQDDPRKYEGSLNQARAVFEVVAVVMTVVYLLVEILQLAKEIDAKVGVKEVDGKTVNQYGVYLPWATIFKLSKIIYILALIGIVSVVPCQLLGYQTPARSIATVAYLVIFLRLSDYFALNVDFGTYTNTFKEIVRVDIKQFMCIIAFVVMAFSGSIYMAMAASKSFDTSDPPFDNFWDILLQEIRAMFEGKEFADSYSPYHVVLTLLILVSMFSIIIVMGNVLIGQISERYTAARNIATIQCDIDKAKLIVAIERSVFPFLRNKRRGHFRRGLYVNNQELVSDLLKDWNTYFAQESNAVSDVQELVNKKILKQRK